MPVYVKWISENSTHFKKGTPVLTLINGAFAITEMKRQFLLRDCRCNYWERRRIGLREAT